MKPNLEKMICVVIMIYCIHFFSYSNDTHQESNDTKLLYQSVLPATLIISGSILSECDIKYQWQHKFPRTDTSIDDGLWTVPSVAMYLFDFYGYESENDWFDKSKYLGIAMCANYITINTLKYLVNETRPDSSNNYSFPSAHTSLAFVSATTLFHEYKDINPYIAYGGFLFAGATAYLRITNNKHFVSDVLAGAGIGILVTNMVYHFRPLANWRPFDNKDISMHCYCSGSSLEMVLHF